MGKKKNPTLQYSGTPVLRYSIPPDENWFNFLNYFFSLIPQWYMHLTSKVPGIKITLEKSSGNKSIIR